MLVDAENVRRLRWPNDDGAELVDTDQLVDTFSVDCRSATL